MKPAKQNTTIKYDIAPLPKSVKQALEWVMLLVNAADDGRIKQVHADQFKRGWYSIGFLYVGLHPDSVLDHGQEQSCFTEAIDTRVLSADPRLASPFYAQSGWPVVLAPVAAEAWRRYELGELGDHEFYCSDAVIAGICFRRPELNDSVMREREMLLH